MTPEQIRDHMAAPITAGGHGISFAESQIAYFKVFHDRDHDTNADFLSHYH